MDEPWFKQLRLLLLDIDGVLFSGLNPIPGAAEAIHKLRGAGISIRLLTNDAVSSRASRLAEFTQYGFDVAIEEIYTASYLTAEYLRMHGSPSVMLLLGGEGRNEFADISVTETDPQVVVVGDYFDDYVREHLQKAFDAVLNGAQLIAAQKNRYWMDGERPMIDIGFWVAGLEYCTRKRAKIIGKPAVESYLTVLHRCGVSPEQAAMASDDPYSDLLGAKRAGLRTVHVLAPGHPPPRSKYPRPDLTVSNLLELADSFVTA